MGVFGQKADVGGHDQSLAYLDTQLCQIRPNAWGRWRTNRSPQYRWMNFPFSAIAFSSHPQS